MQFDVEMVLLAGGLVSAAQGFVLLYFWLRDRASTYMAWWAGSFLLGGVMRILVEFLPWSFDERNFFGILVIMLAYGMSWQGVRSFGGRPVVLPLVFLPPACWVVIGFSGLFENGSFGQMRAVSFLYAFTWAVSSFEFWRAGKVSMSARMPMIVLCASIAGLYVIRMLFVGVLPYPIGVAASTAWAYPALFTISIITTLPFATFAIALSREAGHPDVIRDSGRNHILSRSTFFASVRLLLRQARAGGSHVALSFVHVDIGDSEHPADAPALDRVVRRFEMAGAGHVQSSIVGRAEFASVMQRVTAVEALAYYSDLLDETHAVCARNGWKLHVGVASTSQVGYDVNALISAAYSALDHARNAEVHGAALYAPAMNRMVRETDDDIRVVAFPGLAHPRLNVPG